MMNQSKIEIPKKCLFLLQEKYRYKVLHGGRGSGKSQSIATSLLILSLQKKIRVLCCRQIQSSITDSVYALLKQIINDLKLDSYFYITRDSIKSCIGSEFIFKGLKQNVAEIKSLQGINYAWAEEAESITDESWDILVPTIREEGSEIWISFNPNLKSDATYQRFVENPTSDCKSVQINYKDNPFFPEVLRLEMEKMKKENYPRYLHIWEGQPNTEGGNLIFIKDFMRYDIAPNQFNSVFICCDTAFSEKKKADNSVFMLCGVLDGKLYILDLYCKKVTFPDLCKDLKNFYQRAKNTYPNFSSIYIENKASGISLVQQLRLEGLPILEIYPTVKNNELKKEIVSDKYTRYLEIESEIKSGRVYIPNSAYWLPEFEFECENFDGGRQESKDDCVDALIYSLKVFRKSIEVNWIEVDKNLSLW